MPGDQLSLDLVGQHFSTLATRAEHQSFLNTLEQCRFELQRPTYMQIFSHKYSTMNILSLRFS